MSLRDQVQIPQSWAFESFGYDKLESALSIAENMIIQEALEPMVQIKTEGSDLDFLHDAIHVCEIAALDWWGAARHPTETNEDDCRSFRQVCGLAFTILRSLPFPLKQEEQMSHILRLIALGYLSDRSTDVQRWLKARSNWSAPRSDRWNVHVLGNVVEAWVRLVRRENWDDVSGIANTIVSLRETQSEHERDYLQQYSGGNAVGAVADLVAMYHWAKCTETLAEYMLQGTPSDVGNILDFHFERAINMSDQSGNLELATLLRWLHLASHRFVSNSIWNVSKRFNTNITRYVNQLVSQGMATLELLPPQRTAIFQQGLLDRTHNAIVVSLPTSSGKTHLAIFRILEAINHFGEKRGWIAYTAPTRALVNQVANRLRRELSPLGIVVEQLKGSAELDQFEEELLDDERGFDVLVCTPEKLDVIIRQKKIDRDFVLYIMDEAHSIEDKTRGLKHELLLAMIRRDCPSAKFLLLTPFVSNGLEIARWLDPQAPGSISMSVDWQPNDRVIGHFWAEEGETPRQWVMKYETLSASQSSLEFDDAVQVGKVGLLDVPYSSIKSNLTKMATAMAVGLHERGTPLVIAPTKPSAWSAARELKSVLPKTESDERVRSVMRFLDAEFNDYELQELLEHGVAVHHSGLSEEARFLVEWLAEESLIKVLCATTTIAQGINFPSSAVLLASTKYPWGNSMSYREFWNLAGRAGRVGQPGVGFVGVATARDDQLADFKKYLEHAHGQLLSSLLNLYAELRDQSGDLNLRHLASIPAWSAFLQYLAHLFNHSDRQRLLGAQLELTLRDTLGYLSLEKTDPKGARDLVDAVRSYITYLMKHPENAKLAESTGFAPDNAYEALRKVKAEGFALHDWQAGQLFDKDRPVLRKLMGVMLGIPELEQLRGIAKDGLGERQLADLTADWVNGHSMRALARRYFNGDGTHQLTKCCDAIYGKIVTNATWGLSSLQKLSGIDFDNLSTDERKELNRLPAMIYYGVNSEEAVLMRMNAVPRSLANIAGEKYKQDRMRTKKANSKDALAWLSQLDDQQWKQMLPSGFPMNGSDCHLIWGKLSGTK